MRTLELPLYPKISSKYSGPHFTICRLIYGSVPNLLLSLPEDQMNYANHRLVEPEEENNYQEYFNYIMENAQREFPSNWKETLRLY